MKKLAFLTLLALALGVSACGNSSMAPTTTTAASGNWEAKFTGGTGAASSLNFVTAFAVTDVSGNNESLDITGFGFYNANACFETGKDNETVSGTASFATNSTGQVTGTITYTVQSIVPAGNTLTLTGNLTGTSNGTTTTTGTLSNGVVSGTWTLAGGAGDPSCKGTGPFLMCQGAATCVVP